MKSINLHLSLRALGYLVALAETRHFGKAAELCFVSQPTLSAQIKKMEEQLGVQLVERGQSVRLTEVGERIVERARRIIADARDIEEMARFDETPVEPMMIKSIIISGNNNVGQLLDTLNGSDVRIVG